MATKSLIKPKAPAKARRKPPAAPAPLAAAPSAPSEPAPLEPLLSPDELIRFRKEATLAREHFSDFAWKDGAGRAWTIRPAVANNHSVVLIEAHRGDEARSHSLSTMSFSEDAAEEAIRAIDASLR